MYDHKKDYEEYMSGAQDFAHARLAKKLMDKKRKAKMMGGHSEEHESPADEAAESPEEQAHEAEIGAEKHPQVAAMLMVSKAKPAGAHGKQGSMHARQGMDGHDEEHETLADEMSESPAEQSMEAAAGTEKHGKISIDVTPEELAQLKAMRSAKA